MLLTGETQRIVVITKIDYEPILEIELNNYGSGLFKHKTEESYLMAVGCFWKHESIPEHLKLIVDEVMTEMWETPEKRIVCYYKDKYYCYWCNSNIFKNCSLEKTVRWLPMKDLEEAEELQALMKKDYEDRNITNRHLILDYDLTDTVSDLNKKYKKQNGKSTKNVNLDLKF